MVLGEREKPTSSDFWEKCEPAMTLRPHHLTGMADLRDAICGEKITSPRHIRGISRSEDPGEKEYYDDVYGERGTSFLRVRNDWYKIFNNVSQLGEEDVVEFSPKPDPICESCEVGRHCRATNFMSVREPGSTIIRESSHMGLIKEALRESGFVYGRDFMLKRGTMKIIDFGGQALDAIENLNEVIVEYEAILVRVKTLREIIPYIERKIFVDQIREIKNGELPSR